MQNSAGFHGEGDFAKKDDWYWIPWCTTAILDWCTSSPPIKIPSYGYFGWLGGGKGLPISMPTGLHININKPKPCPLKHNSASLPSKAVQTHAKQCWLSSQARQCRHSSASPSTPVLAFIRDIAVQAQAHQCWLSSQTQAVQTYHQSQAYIKILILSVLVNSIFMLSCTSKSLSLTTIAHFVLAGWLSTPIQTSSLPAPFKPASNLN